jgi:hypothetical protein
MTDEQVTFAGIPIPLKLETILNAYTNTHSYIKPQRVRLNRELRSRILRMDNRLNFTIGVAMERGERILELEQENQRLRALLDDAETCLIMDEPSRDMQTDFIFDLTKRIRKELSDAEKERQES